MNLVTREGEDILASYDDWAIREFRRNRLIWRSWGRESTLSDPAHTLITDAHGIRQVDVDSARIRLFFLSLLWRAAATKLPEFAEIVVPEADLEGLRECIISGQQPPVEFYPIMLTQLSTRGPPHNMTAVAQEKIIPDLGQRGPLNVPIFRFYFDGLIAHFHRNSQESLMPELGPLVVGNEPKLVLSTVTYERSWQLENLETVRTEAERDFPHELDRILRKGV